MERWSKKYEHEGTPTYLAEPTNTVRQISVIKVNAPNESNNHSSNKPDSHWSSAYCSNEMINNEIECNVAQKQIVNDDKKKSCVSSIQVTSQKPISLISHNHKDISYSREQPNQRTTPDRISRSKTFDYLRPPKPLDDTSSIIKHSAEHLKNRFRTFSGSRQADDSLMKVFDNDDDKNLQRKFIEMTVSEMSRDEDNRPNRLLNKKTESIERFVSNSYLVPKTLNNYETSIHRTNPCRVTTTIRKFKSERYIPGSIFR